MKKIILFISLIALTIIPVYAKENKLYFTEKDNRIYYDSILLDEDLFMKHIEMVPGDSYIDELIIENGTNTKYTLYFKVLPREQSAAANELLENIIMKIKLDETIVYEGKATGLDYNSQGVDLQKAILLGEFTPSKSSKMVVETKLSEMYSNVNLNELSYIDWSFYAEYDGSNQPTEIVPSPYTMIESVPSTLIISVCMAILGLGLLVYANKAKN